MNVLRGLAMALSTYSRLPAPMVEWTQEGRRWTLVWFPVVGLAVGASLWLWLLLCRWLQINILLQAAGCTALPIWVTGGIHMDGFCDVCDALASHSDRSRMLEIMKDPHTGAFAIIGCQLYLLITFALWTQAEPRYWHLALLLFPVLSRALSALFALTLPNARGTGMLSQVADGGRAGRWVLIPVSLVCAILLAIQGVSGLGILAGMLCAAIWYGRLTMIRFHGTTGDLSGWFLQMCELMGLAGAVAAQSLMR